MIPRLIFLKIRRLKSLQGPSINTTKDLSIDAWSLDWYPKDLSIDSNTDPSINNPKDKLTDTSNDPLIDTWYHKNPTIDTFNDTLIDTPKDPSVDTTGKPSISTTIDPSIWYH